MNPALGYKETLEMMKEKKISYDLSYELNETMKVKVLLT